MKTRTAEFKANVKELGRELDTILTYTYGNETIDIDNEDLYSVVPHYESKLLSTAMKQLDIDSAIELPIGAIISMQFGIKVRNNEVEDYRDNYDYVNFGNYVVEKIEKKEDTNSYFITCYDRMLYSMVDYEDMEITYPITVRDYINAIATHLGLTFKNANDTSFVNWNKQIPNEKYLMANGDSMGYKFRDVLDELAQVTASTICINEDDDELEIRYITNTLDTIDEAYLKDTNVNFKGKYGPVNSIVLSRAAESDNVYLQDQQSIEENGLCEIKIIDNQIMNGNDRADYLVDILSKLDGLEYYLNDFESIGITYYNVCDKYNIQVGDNTYPCVMFNDDIQIKNGLKETIYTEIPKETQTDYSKADKTDRKINQTYLIIDKQNQTIESVVSNVGEQDEKISQITQTVNELNAKISDVADVTVTAEDTDAKVELENINASEPINVKIHPISGNISYLYPRSNLYPSSSLFSTTRTIRFTNTSTNETFDLILPDDLLYYDSNNYDEFILDYENEIFRVNKKCKYNADGTVGLLSIPETNDYTYQHINLSDGDYTVEVLGYSSAYIYVRLMAANIYTTQFATKVEMTSAINQTANSINLRVDEKLDEEDFTHAEIVAKINDDTSQVKIDADQVNIEANDVINILAGNTINLTSKAIAISSDNFSVDTSGNMTCSNANVTGVVNATSGTIGNFTLNSNRLYSGQNNYTAGIGVYGQDYAFWAGDTTSSNAPFRVDHNGNLTATSANIAGTVNAYNGVIGGCNISNGSLQITDANISGTLSANKISGGTINANNINVTNLSATNITRGSIGGIPYSYNSSSNGSIDIGNGSDGVVIGSIRGSKRWSLASFTAGGRFQTFDSGGNMAAYFNQTGAHSSSDIRLKNNIKNINEDKSMNIINNLTPIEYTYKSDEKTFHRGLSAQEVENVLKNNGIKKEIFEINKEGYYSLNYIELIPDLINCIKYLNKEVQKLKEEK